MAQSLRAALRARNVAPDAQEAVGHVFALAMQPRIAALDDEHLYGAGLDVVYPEPLPDGHPLLTHPKVILSPHIAGGTVEATEGLARSAAEQIMTVLHGTLPKFPVNPDVWRSDQSRRPQ